MPTMLVRLSVSAYVLIAVSACTISGRESAFQTSVRQSVRTAPAPDIMLLRRMSQ